MAQPSLPQRFFERRHIDDDSPRDIDQGGRRFHEGEFLRANEPVRLRGGWGGQNDKIGLGKKSVQVGQRALLLYPDHRLS